MDQFSFAAGTWGALALVVLAYAIGLLGLAVFALAGVVLALRMHNERKAARWERQEQAWSPLVLSVLAEDLEPEAILASVKRDDRLMFVDYLLRFTSPLRGRELDRVRALARPFLAPIAEHLRKGDETQRARAVRTLATLGFAGYRPEVLAALDDPAPIVGIAAARSLCLSGESAYAPAILDRLGRFEHWSPRFLASMFAEMGAGAAPALRQVLLDPARPSVVRAIAAQALCDLKDAHAAGPAAALLLEEEDAELRVAVLRLLGRVGRPEALPAVRAALRSADPVVRAQAMQTLGVLGAPEDLKELRRGFEDPFPWVAVHAAEGLRRLGCRDVLQSMVRMQHPRANFAQEVLDREALS
ncbi:MAG: HEAT repeat domain-containing protein [Planctomycetes bacterium]|nr:HEAT repeat domain-containing protein [Planctomycetota bacterium]